MYTREHPSPHYRTLLALNCTMHEQDNVFAGHSLTRHINDIHALIVSTGARTVLDYGSGKGEQYIKPLLHKGKRYTCLAELWDVSIRLYDPCVPLLEDPPRVFFDGVVSTDVLEHCDEQDIPWILDEIFMYARRFVFLSIACYAASKVLPNGENAHRTVRSREWWDERIRRAIAACVTPSIVAEVRYT